MHICLYLENEKLFNKMEIRMKYNSLTTELYFCLFFNIQYFNIQFLI